MLKIQSNQLNQLKINGLVDFESLVEWVISSTQYDLAGWFYGWMDKSIIGLFEQVELVLLFLKKCKINENKKWYT